MRNVILLQLAVAKYFQREMHLWRASTNDYHCDIIIYFHDLIKCNEQHQNHCTNFNVTNIFDKYKDSLENSDISPSAYKTLSLFLLDLTIFN